MRGLTKAESVNQYSSKDLFTNCSRESHFFFFFFPGSRKRVLLGGGFICGLFVNGSGMRYHASSLFLAGTCRMGIMPASIGDCFVPTAC